MSMDVDDSAGAVSSRHPPCDSVERDSPGPFGGWMPSNLPLHRNPFPGRECPAGLDDAPPPTTSPSSSFVNYVEETGQIYRNYGQARQQWDTLSSFEPEVTQRKRKHTDDPPHPHVTEDDDGFTDSAYSLPPRRVRPRLRVGQAGEFSPLLVLSLGQERDPVEEGEDTILKYYYSPNVTNPSRSIRRYFDPGPGPARDRDACILQRSSSPQFNDLEDRKERRRSDSANSLAEAALASTNTAAPKRSRLSTLQDLGLPRPFEDTEQRPSLGSIAVHERGLDAGSLFLSTKSGRAGDPSVSREPGNSSSSGLPALEPNLTKYFDQPICDSPDSIDPDNHGSRQPWAT